MCFKAFGDPSHYYADQSAGVRKTEKDHLLEEATKTAQRLLNAADGQVFDRVTRTYRTWNSILRERAERPSISHRKGTSIRRAATKKCPEPQQGSMRRRSASEAGQPG